MTTTTTPMDATTLAILETKKLFSEDTTILDDPTEKGIPQRFIDFADKFHENIGGTRIIFAHMTKSIYLDRPGKKPYKYNSSIAEPTCYFDSPSYHICIFYNRDVLELHLMDVVDKNKGLGTRLMNAILDAADDLGMKVKLIPIAYQSSDTPNFVSDCDRLKTFYKSFGFKPNNLNPYLTYIP